MATKSDMKNKQLVVGTLLLIGAVFFLFRDRFQNDLNACVEHKLRETIAVGIRNAYPGDALMELLGVDNVKPAAWAESMSNLFEAFHAVDASDTKPTVNGKIAEISVHAKNENEQELARNVSRFVFGDELSTTITIGIQIAVRDPSPNATEVTIVDDSVPNDSGLEQVPPESDIVALDSTVPDRHSPTIVETDESMTEATPEPTPVVDAPMTTDPRFDHRPADDSVIFPTPIQSDERMVGLPPIRGDDISQLGAMHGDQTIIIGGLQHLTVYTHIGDRSCPSCGTTTSTLQSSAYSPSSSVGTSVRCSGVTIRSKSNACSYPRKCSKPKSITRKIRKKKPDCCSNFEGSY